MTTEQFATLATDFLNAGMDGSQTSCVVVSASLFPSSPQYRIQIDNELMLVTAGTGTTSWTVTRAIEGTSAASHSSGARVTLVLTAAALGGQSDPAAGTPGLRSLGTGAQQAAPGTEATRALAAEALLAPLASPTFTGAVHAPEFAASGSSGATSSSRYAGATTSGAPVSGTFSTGDFIIDRGGSIWICTTGGTSGTWKNASSVETARALVAEALLAPLASPALTGTPTAPTAAQGTNTTQIATTAMVHSEAVLLAPLASPTFTGSVTTPAETITNPNASVALQVNQNANASASTSVGGAVNINNSGSTGAGLVVYSSQASPSGRLIVARADNAAFAQAAIYAENAGTGHALFANQTVVTPNSTGSAINAVSANTGASAVQVSGTETGRGTIKVTHTGTGSDANASGLSIDLQGSGTAAQGIFIDATTAGTTGALIQVRNNGNVIWKLATDGTFAVPVLTVAGITETYGTAAPGSGTYALGSRVWNLAPEAGGNMGWVCTTAGTPGTWNPFGVIGV